MSKLKWVTGAAAVAFAGAAMAYSAGGTAGAATTPAKPAAQTKAAQTKAAPARPRVLSGKRQVTIVRVQAFEGGLSMLDGRLTEVDDDRGRQLFVPTPVGRNQYVIKSYTRPTDDPASLEPLCWQASRPGGSAPLTVEGAACDTKNPRQQFRITDVGGKEYAIDNASAYLQYSPTRGLILEELGDAPLLSTFRLVDNGPAPR